VQKLISYYAGGYMPESTNQSGNAISEEEMKAALERSGYLLETRVETLISARPEGFYVETNPTYRDSSTGKMREFDLYAMTGVGLGSSAPDFVFGVLLVECKKVDTPVVFFSQRSSVAELYQHNVRVAGMPVKLRKRGRQEQWASLAEYLNLQSYHHYCQGPFARQWCSFSKKKRDGQWMAHHPNRFDEVDKLRDITNSYVDAHFKSWVKGAGHSSVNLELYYPVILIEGELFEAQTEGRQLHLVRTKHVRFLQETGFGEWPPEHQVDIIVEDFLPDYLDMIYQELSTTAEQLAKGRADVQRAIRILDRRAENARTPDELRAALDSEMTATLIGLHVE
jgi:hypothetical protein